MKFVIIATLIITTQACLDTKFGYYGTVLTQFGSKRTNSVASAGVAINKNNGKIAVIGYATQGGPNQFAVAQYLSSGAPDNSFDSEGQVLTTIFNSRHESGATCAEYQSDNNLVVGGSVYTATSLFDYDFACVRYTPSGELDESFGKAGKAIIDFASGDDEASALVIQKDGKIVLAGHATKSDGSVGFAAIRLTTTGDLDSSFGVDGKVVTTFGETVDRANDLVILSDGSMVLVGTAIINKKNVFALLKYTSSGSLYTKFGSGGKTITSILGEDSASAVVAQPDGKLVVVGSSSALIGLAGSSIVIARYSQDGELDTTFGKDGLVISNFGYQDAVGADLVLVGSNIALTGYIINKFSKQYSFVASLNSKGGVRDSFTPYFSSPADDQVKSTGIALDGTGRVVVASTAAVSRDFTGFGLARFTCLEAPTTTPPPTIKTTIITKKPNKSKKPRRTVK